MKTPEEYAKDCNYWDVSYPQLRNMFRLIQDEAIAHGMTIAENQLGKTLAEVKKIEI